MPGGLGILLRCLDAHGQVRQQALIASRQLAATGKERIQPGQLRQPQGSLQVGDAIVEAQFKLLVVPGTMAFFGHLARVTADPVTAQPAQTRGQIRTRGKHHAALGRGDDLYRVKAEHRHVGIFATADRLARVTCADRVGSVLDKGKAILPGQHRDRTHVGALPGKGHGDYYLGQAPLPGGLLEFQRKCLGVDSPGVRVDIDEIDTGAAVAPTVG
ncbi:hypothetical protein D3C79_792730 [compost metagenome]